MACGHYMELINKQIELIYYSNQGINWTDSENMSSDELEFIIYNFKTIKEQEIKSSQDFKKAVFDYANKALETLFTLLGKLGRGK